MLLIVKGVINENTCPCWASTANRDSTLQYSTVGEVMMGSRFSGQGQELSRHLLHGFYAGTSDSTAFETIENNADRVLAETGLRIDDCDTVELLRSAGAVLKEGRVYFDGPMLREIIRKSAPRRFMVRGRNPERDITVGIGDAAQFAPMYGAPDVLLDSGERVKGKLALYREMVSIVHDSPGITNTGHMICVIDDVDEPQRPWAMLHAHLSYSDKPFMGCIASAQVASEFIAITKNAVGRPAEQGVCNLVHLLNCTPPLTYWENPLKCLRSIAEAGEASMVSSYMMMGATSPVTIAGALTQGYAEVLVGMALAQLWNPGCPVIMGVLGWPFDMRRMLPNFGDPASQLLQFYAAELARRLGVPCRADGAVTSAKVDDAQAGAEGARNLAAAIDSGASFVLHSAGWLEQGRCLSMAKLRRDADAISKAYFDGESCAPPLALDPTLERTLLARFSTP